jgi:hypothetical protein
MGPESCCGKNPSSLPWGPFGPPPAFPVTDCDAPKQPSVVAHAVGYTREHLEKLESLLTGLEVRLSPVLRNIPVPCQGECVNESAGCALGDEVLCLGDRVKACCGHVSELLDRLGV